MIVELEPTGRGSIARIDLVNDGLRDIPYEVQMMRGTITPEGELQLSPADAEFIVFPAQTIVESNSQQVFRIQYVGEEALARSQVYYMSIRQIPVDFEQNVSQIQMVVNYNVLVNVVPDGTRAEPAIRSASLATRQIPGPRDPDDADADAPMVEQRGIEVDLGNVGSRFFLAGLSDWSITGRTTAGEPFEMTLEGDEASRLIGVGVVAPDANRLFFIPTDTPLDPQSIRVTVEP
ncbi:fimbria/pilus periplasmic chaperone [Aurantiacibacter aquimixticola]|nr:fimbria/pilus periplasmic chaperone [Aurantiacibacter aquimixticola]